MALPLAGSSGKPDSAYVSLFSLNCPFFSLFKLNLLTIRTKRTKKNNLRRISRLKQNQVFLMIVLLWGPKRAEKMEMDR